MSVEPSRPGQLRKRQLDDLRHYLVDQVHPHVPLYRRALDDAGVDRGRIAGFDEFMRLPLATLDEIGSGVDHLMEPTLAGIRRAGPIGLRARAHLATLTGGGQKLAHDLVGPRYKPVLWTIDGQLRTGWSASDLWRLGDLGRRMLERAGVRGGDRLVSVGLDTDRLEFWQVSLGARAGGVAAFHMQVPRPEVLDGGDVSIVVGTVAAIDGLLGARADHRVTTAIVIAPPGDARGRGDLMSRWRTEVVYAWAPAGVRSLWSERRGVPGLITSADAEVIEIVDGEVVWSSLGWAGTVLLRLRTGVHATQQALSSGTGGVAVTLCDPVVVAC